MGKQTGRADGDYLETRSETALNGLGVPAPFHPFHPQLLSRVRVRVKPP
jgi:hypothetical protein